MIKFDVKNCFSGEVQFTAKIDCADDTPISIKLGLAVKWAIKTGADLAGADLAGADLADAYLAGANLARAYLAGAYLAGANLARANLADAYLAGANLARAYLAGANLARANLADAYLAGANLARANLAGANLARADLAGADLAGADLADAYLAGANLARANLADAYLAGADLARANLADAYLAGANLRSFKADMWMTLTQAGAPHVIDLIAKLRAGEVDGSTYSEENGCACLVGTLEKHGATGVDRGASNPAERWFAPIKPGDVPNGEGEGPFRARLAIEWAEEWCAANGVTVSPQARDAENT